ncbi:MAG: hypothetical protein NVSMB38_13280 [Ktedonobacteraceae bacterium]
MYFRWKMTTARERRVSAIFLLCGVLLTFLVGLFIPAIPRSASESPSTQPYPTSKYVTVSSVDPTLTSIGDTQAGDNWASTWADDDTVYTYFDDGTGFGFSSARSMYPAKIFGNPAHGSIVGVNINTNTIGQDRGGGSSGRKVSGLLSVPEATSPTGQVLYAWVRNVTQRGGASLMYSYDHAVTWAWAWGDPSTTPSAVIPELGYPTWMQAGKNAAAAQDNYFYFYSQDAPTAYQVSDNVILGRVDKTHVKVKSAYRYFAGLDGHGNPLWTSDISFKKPVFTARKQSYRVFVTYNPALKRYFLLTANGDRLNSNWKAGYQTHNLGIYEASTPWGVWSTVYYNDKFHPNIVFAPQMVSKWIAADGKSFYLLFSSYQSGSYRFNIQKIVLTVKERFQRI